VEPRQEKVSFMYRFAMRVLTPWVKWWGRMQVSGLEAMPLRGPVLLAGNHDSYWDPVAIGIAGLQRRQIRALAKSTLWNIKPLGPILNGMGQIPIRRGAGDIAAMDEAIAQLRGGACIGVFPEGTTSRGRELRARSGFGRLALEVPEARIVCVTVKGAIDLVRFPKRPRIEVHFFEPAPGDAGAGEDAAGLSTRLMAEIREQAPVVFGGRRRKNARWRRDVAAEKLKRAQELDDPATAEEAEPSEPARS
jgi:1-acyl-sn-glycerol-3-phosphate acyltransferase